MFDRKMLLVKARRVAAVAFVACAACASEGSEEVQAELTHLGARAAEGIHKIERALEDPELTSRQLGEGVRAVEAATRQMAALELHPDASEIQRLMVMLQQARAWDDASLAIVAGARSDRGLDAAQQSLLAALLEEKAQPARLAAQAGYERTLRMACRLGASDHPVILEILDGTERYSGTAPPADRPCEEQ